MADWNEFKSQESRQIEIQLVKSIEKNAILVTKLEEAQDEIERSHDQISAQLLIIEEYKQRIKKLEDRLHITNSNSERFSSNRKSLDENDKKIEELLVCIRNKDRVIETLTSNQIFSQEKQEELFLELEAKNRELEKLSKKLKNTEKSIDTLFLNHKTEGQFVSELEHLKVDNQRLLSLLSKSQEYKFLGQFIEDSGGAHYIQSQKPLNDESCNWVPSQLTKVIEIYKKSPKLENEVMNTLLLEINKSFREREKTQILKLKHEYKTKINDLKRQLLMRQPYDNVKTQRQVSRLKTELKKANNEISTIVAKPSNVIPKMQDLEETFKILNDLRHENSKLSEENSKLKKSSKNKSQFIEGVGWLGEKVMKEKSEMHKLISGLLSNFEFDGTASKEKQDWLLVFFT